MNNEQQKELFFNCDIGTINSLRFDINQINVKRTYPHTHSHTPTHVMQDRRICFDCKTKKKTQTIYDDHWKERNISLCVCVSSVEQRERTTAKYLLTVGCHVYLPSIVVVIPFVRHAKFMDSALMLPRLRFVLHYSNWANRQPIRIIPIYNPSQSKPIPPHPSFHLAM